MRVFYIESLGDELSCESVEFYSVTPDSCWDKSSLHSLFVERIILSHPVVSYPMKYKIRTEQKGRKVNKEVQRFL